MRLFLALMLAIFASGTALADTSPCFHTPAEAVAGLQAGADAGRTGFHVVSTRFDELLGRTWAVVASCEHPERPSLIVAGGTVTGRRRAAEVRGAAAQATPPVIRAGSRVRLLRNEADVHVEMAAVADTSGRIGDRIRVHVMRVSTETGGTQMYMTGIVRGPDYLEMEP